VRSDSKDEEHRLNVFSNFKTASENHLTAFTGQNAQNKVQANAKYGQYNYRGEESNYLGGT